MSELLTPAFVAALVTAALLGAVPVLLAALGETLSEQSGVLGLGTEGMLLVGGLASFATVLGTGSFWLGFLAGAVAGAAAAAITAVLCVGLGLNQVVVGLAVTVGGSGLTSVLYQHWFGETGPRLGAPDGFPLPGLRAIPVVGDALFGQHAMVPVAAVLVVLVGWWLRRTGPGLRLRVAGQRPQSLDAAGGSVLRVRAGAVLAAGVLSGLGGAFLATVTAGTFTPFMTHGLGFIAIVLAMLARGSALGVALGALLYGGTVAAGTALQFASGAVPTDVIQMLPFALIMLVLLLFSRSQTLPPALGTPYVRGSRV